MRFYVSCLRDDTYLTPVFSMSLLKEWVKTYHFEASDSDGIFHVGSMNGSSQ